MILHHHEQTDGKKPKAAFAVSDGMIRLLPCTPVNISPWSWFDSALPCRGRQANKVFASLVNKHSRKN
jgi:hypothetical protein